MKLKEIKKILDEALFIENQEDWDNSGLLVGDEGKLVNNALICLELTRESLNFAIDKKFDMIVTHHPAIFSPIKNVIKKEDEESYIYDLIKNDIALYACHTNFDKLNGGMDNYIGRLLGGKKFRGLENSDYGLIFNIDQSTAKYVGQRLIELLSLDGISAIGNVEKEISTVAVVTGSGTDMYKFAKASGAELFITGDIKYHFAQEALNDEMVVFDIGHYGSEKIFPQVFVEKCATVLKDLSLECYTGNQNPFTLIGKR